MANYKVNLKKRRLARIRLAFYLAFICIIAVLICVIISIFKHKDDKPDDNFFPETELTFSTTENIPEETTISDVTEFVPTELTLEEKKQYILDNPDEFTEELIGFAEKYDQVINYVYNYKDRDSINVSLNIYNDETETDFPLYIQWDERWGYESYGDSLIGVSGCGPTSLAMVYKGLTGESDQTPDTICAMSEQNGYYVSGVGTSWDLMSKGANDLGLNSEQLALYEGKLKEELDNGHPIICSMSKGDFTQGGHFIVIAGYTDDGFIVNDPNSRENSSKYWEYSVLEPQIKNLWSFSK